MTVTWTPCDMRILYLEDEAIIALETVEVLRDIGFCDVCMAYSLPMADKVLDEGMPDLALLDVNLSHGRTSFDLGRRLLEAGVPVVFATGYAVGTLPADPRAVVIEKPMTPQMVDDALQAAVARRATAG